VDFGYNCIEITKNGASVVWWNCSNNRGQVVIKVVFVGVIGDITLLAKFYVTSFLLNVKFWQMDQVFAAAIYGIYHCSCALMAILIVLFKY